MANVQVDPELPDITPAQGPTGWRREFCIELLGDGGARIFVRAVESSSFKATELQRAITAVRLKVEQIQLVSGVGQIGLGRIGLQGA